MQTLNNFIKKYRHRNVKALSRFIRAKLKIVISDKVLIRRIDRLDES